MSLLKRLISGKPKAAVQDPPPPPFGTIAWHPTHRHKKGGGYRLLGFGINEADRTEVAIYDDADGTVWVRARAEFEDGRFTPITMVDPKAQAPSKATDTTI